MSTRNARFQIAVPLFPRWGVGPPCPIPVPTPAAASELGNQLRPDRDHGDKKRDRRQRRSLFHECLQHGFLLILERKKNIVPLLFQGVKRVKKVKKGKWVSLKSDPCGQFLTGPLPRSAEQGRRDMETTAPINSGILPGWREMSAWLSSGISSSILSLVFSTIFCVLAA